ncbi:MAG: transcriptional regulator [Circular genetic element sp.]|nr:MAG: transcriptional regulator [Circular genetic element sp.]
MAYSIVNKVEIREDIERGAKEKSYRKLANDLNAHCYFEDEKISYAKLNKVVHGKSEMTINQLVVLANYFGKPVTDYFTISTF